MIIPLGLEIAPGLPAAYPRVAAAASSFERVAYRLEPALPSLFGLAPRGVFRAPDVAIRAVGSYPTFSPRFCQMRCAETGGAVVSRRPAAEATDSITGQFNFLYGTFRSRRKILRSCQWQLRRAPRDNPLALPGASPCSPTLLRAEDYGSPDFPPVCVSCERAANRRSSDSPASFFIIRHHRPIRTLIHLEGNELIHNPQSGRSNDHALDALTAPVHDFHEIASLRDHGILCIEPISQAESVAVHITRNVDFGSTARTLGKLFGKFHPQQRDWFVRSHVDFCQMAAHINCPRMIVDRVFLTNEGEG